MPTSSSSPPDDSDPSEDSTELFDQIAIWKADAVESLGLQGDDVFAAVSPGPAFPAVLHTIADALPQHDGAPTYVDLGAGLGGASAWFAHRCGAHVIAVEPARGSRIAAVRLFPELEVREGSAQSSGLPDGCADVVLALGVISLLDDLTGFLDEARRLLAAGGVIGIADMFLAHGDTERQGINTLRTVEATARQLADASFAVEVIDRADDPGPEEPWADAAGRVKAHLLEVHAGEPALEAWLQDLEQIHGWMSSDHVVAACVVCTPT